MIFINLYTYLACLFITPSDREIDILFNKWNESTLESVNYKADHAAYSKEKSFYIEMSVHYREMQGTIPDRYNRESLRWMFLKTISDDFDWKNSRWTVIEDIKSGEVTRLKNYLIIHHNDTATVITYQWINKGWKKRNREEILLSEKDSEVKNIKGRFMSGNLSNHMMVTVTSFESDQVCASIYYPNE